MRPSSRTLVVWLPDWPVAAAAGSRAGGTGRPRCIAVADHGRILACSPAARAGGVRRGMSVREAQAACPPVRIARHDPHEAARSFDDVLAALEEVVAGVHPVRPGLCAVPARGPARFYGGEDAACHAVLARVAGFGVSAPRAGVADGIFAAEQAARRARPGRALVVPPGRQETAAFLAPLPTAVALPADTAALLRRLGVAALGDLARLDTAAVRDRFGPEAARARGLAAGLPVPVPAAPGRRDLSAAVDFEPPLDSAEQVAFAFRTAAEHLLRTLGETALLCTAVSVEIHCESEVTLERRWLHPRWFTAAEIVDRVRWQLHSRDAAHARADSPVDRVTVRAVQTVAAAGHQDGLWDSAPRERVHHGLSRVQALLGHDGVATGVLTGGREPAERQRLVPWGERTPERAAAAHSLPWPGRLPEPAPARLFDPPRPARVTAPGGRTVGVDDRGRLDARPEGLAVAAHASSAGPAAGGGEGWRGRPLPVTAWAGPWPVEERWWDARTAHRAYRLQAVDEAGRAWLLLLQDGRWCAQAQYD